MEVTVLVEVKALVAELVLVLVAVYVEVDALVEVLLAVDDVVLVLVLVAVY